MSDERIDYTTKLYQLASPLFLYLVSFRRKVRKGFDVSESMVEQDLREIFGQMEHSVKNDMRLEAFYKEALYPLVVLADEVLLHSEWRHRDSWREHHLLEKEKFKSNIGGDEIFEIASKLKHEQVELAAILFTALSLGTYDNKREQLPEVRAKLYRQLTEYLVEVKPDNLTPLAYRVEERDAARFSRGFTLLHVMAFGLGLIGLYWIAARLSWNALLGDLRNLVEQVITMV